MCGRFGLYSNIKKVSSRYDFLDNDRLEFKNILNKETIYPSEEISTVIVNGITKMSWGIKTSPDSKLIINSRIENIADKKYFYNDFKDRRCIIPASYFYEWDKVNFGNSKYKIYDNDNEIFSIAGIYRYIKDNDKVYKFVSILTKKSEGKLSKIHTRAPIILDKEYEQDFLKKKYSKDIIKELINYNPKLKLNLESNSQMSFI